MNLIDSYNLSMTIELWARTGLKNYTAMGAKRATIIGNASLTWFGFKLSEGQTYYYEDPSTVSFTGERAGTARELFPNALHIAIPYHNCVYRTPCLCAQICGYFD
ncbi:hypothetical protein JHK84_039672 [Glycine max]|nr:hypothetical protein JHK85_040025 [Glycine max]KAG5121332.1 hypothetical protein JHK84_039672 [Glycine max]